MSVTRSCLYLLVASLLISAALQPLQASAAAAAPTAVSAAEEVEVTPFALSPLHTKPPLEWSVKDVEYWMNHTIGYAEYAGYVRANLIDGVTLLEMEPADFESYLPIENALHVVKISAHVKMLKGMCRCTDDADGGALTGRSADFWGYMKQHSARTWAWGTTALFFPRWAMAGVYLFDKELYRDVVGTRSAAGGPVVDRTQAGLYWATFTVAPDLYMAYQAARMTPRNYLLMPCIVAHFLAQAFSEASLLITIYRRTAFKPETPLLTRIWVIFSYTLFAPLLGVVVGFVFPVFLQYITVGVIVAHSFLMILGIVILVMKDGLAAATTGPEDPRHQQQQQQGKESGAGGEGEEAAAEAAKRGDGGEEDADREGVSQNEKID